MSLEAKQIHPAVQKALYRKIDALNRLRLGTNKPFYLKSNALEPSDSSNPIEQQMARMCWARVTSAIQNPDLTGPESLAKQPIYFSSYIEDKGIVIQNANKPLSSDPSRVDTRNYADKTIYRGETGITGIQVSQLSFFIKKMTISFACPNPRDFEQTIQPIFLRHGQFCAVEFGWGMRDTDIKTPPLSLDDIQKLNSSVKERNLASAGNYQCDVGIVSNYTFALNTDGGYEGTIDIITRGQNVLSQTSQRDLDTSRDVLSVQTGLQNLRELERLNRELSKEERENLSLEQNAALLNAGNELDDIEKAKITYKQTMLNLENVVDKYLESVNDITRKIGREGFSDEKYLNELKEQYPGLQAEDANSGRIFYKFKNGALKTEGGFEAWKAQHIKDIVDEKYFMSWGWFEDHILNSFFSINLEITTGKNVESKQLQSIRSVFNDGKINDVQQIKGQKCHISRNLHSKGLNTVILPNKAHPSAFDSAINEYDKELKKVREELELDSNDEFENTARNRLRNRHEQYAAVHQMFKIIDENFKPFVNTYQGGLMDERNFVLDEHGQPDSFGVQDLDRLVKPIGETEAGVIRNMVFPIGKFKEHFTNMETLQQGLRSFWTDVQNEYGGFWSFGIGQDLDNTGRIGIYDLFYTSEAEKVDLFVLDNQSTREDFINYKYKQNVSEDGVITSDKTDKIFTFPLYSRDSFVKDFNLTVKMTSKAATIAVYGGNTNLATGTQRSGDVNDLSLQAYSLLLNPTRESKTKQDTLKSYQKLLRNGVVTNMKFPIDDDMIGTGLSYYNKQNISEVAPTNEEGIDFSNIEESQEAIEIISKLLESQQVNNAQNFYYWYDEDNPGITRFYDLKGDMKSEYIRTMLFLINNSLYNGDDSNIQNTKPVIPIDIDMTIDGVGGLKPFDLFRLDYLPEIYRNFTYFQIFDVGHTISPAGWETNLTAKMKLDLPKYLEAYPGTIKNKVDFDRVAVEFRTKEEIKAVNEQISEINEKILEQEEKKAIPLAKLTLQNAYREAKNTIDNFDESTPFEYPRPDGTKEFISGDSVVVIEQIVGSSYRITNFGELEREGLIGSRFGPVSYQYVTKDGEPVKFNDKLLTPRTFNNSDTAGSVRVNRLKDGNFAGQVEAIEDKIRNFQIEIQSLQNQRRQFGETLQGAIDNPNNPTVNQESY